MFTTQKGVLFVTGVFARLMLPATAIFEGALDLFEADNAMLTRHIRAYLLLEHANATQCLTILKKDVLKLGMSKNCLKQTEILSRSYTAHVVLTQTPRFCARYR